MNTLYPVNCFICANSTDPIKLLNDDIYQYRCPCCGFVKITVEFSLLIDALPNYKYLFSGYFRSRYKNNLSPELISTRNWENVLGSISIPKSLSEKMDYFLLGLNRQSDTLGTYFQLYYLQDYPLAFCINPVEFRFVIRTLMDKNFISVNNFQSGNDIRATITGEGWFWIDEIKKRKSSDSKQVFVAMSFSDSLKTIYDNAIQPAVASAGYSSLRIDKKEHNNDIVDEIIAGIKESKFLVADFTDHKNGVYFEAGYAMGFGIPVIWMCKKEDLNKAHFDTRQYNHIEWSTEEELRIKLENRIKATIS